MSKNILQQAAELKIRYRRRKRWQKVVTFMAGVVVFCTTYALILPAITMEQEVFCGQEEHLHEDACFADPIQKNLVCSTDLLQLHVHTASCYQEETLICGQADYVAHSHDALCYDAGGLLVCTLPERGAHVHGDSCYELPTETVSHVHKEDCFTKEQGELICTAEETDGHAHGPDCSVPGEELLCTTPEQHVHEGDCFTYPLICSLSTEPHSHGDGCYAPSETLLCSVTAGHVHDGACYSTILVCTSQEEGHVHGDECHSTSLTCSIPENHTHSGSCYASELVCTLDTTTAHAHGPECYSTEPQTVCTIPENHVHGSACYNQILVCTQPEEEAHHHGEDCYLWNEVPVCGMEEGDPETVTPEGAQPELICIEPVAETHVHGDDCFETVELSRCQEDHTHTDECEGYDLICTLELHEHTLACYSDPDADVESQATWEATMAGVTLTGDPRADLVAIAKSQLGYTESSRNYAVWEDNTTHGYTRYGAWYGSPYGDWCAMFVSFCLNYADVDNIPLHWGCRPWIEQLTALDLYHSAGEYTPVSGDIIFYDWEGDGLSDHVGIVAEIIPGSTLGDTTVRAIEGNSANCVQYVNYAMDDPRILGYSELPPQEEETAPEYICGLEEHTHSESCYDEEENLLCQLQEHTHGDDCIAQPELPERVETIIAMIDALPDSETVEQTLAACDATGDTAGYEAYYREFSGRAFGTYIFYEDLSEENRLLVSNREKLLALDWLWSARTMELTQEIGVYQVNSYDQENPDAAAGALLLHNTSADALGVDEMAFRYWYAIIVEENENGQLYVNQLLTDLSGTADKSAIAAQTSNGFVLLVYKDMVPALEVSVGNFVSVSFDYTQTAAYTGTSYGTVSFLSQHTLSVEKVLSADDSSVQPLGDPSFRFQVLKCDAEGAKTDELFITPGTAYTIYNTAGAFGTGTTDENGIFTLKAGQRAEFADIAETAGSYVVRELNTGDAAQFGAVTVNGISAEATETGYDSAVTNAADGTASFLFDNQITTVNLGTLSVTKQLEKLDGTTDTETQFTILVQLDDALLPVGTAYTVTAGETSEARTVTVEGEIQVLAGQTAVIEKIIAGTSFKVWEAEASAENYIVSYSGSDGVTGGTTAATGIIHVQSAEEVIVSNAESGTHIAIPVTKTLTVSDGSEHSFRFALEQVTDETGTVLTENGTVLTAEIPVMDQTTLEDAFSLYYQSSQVETEETFFYRIREITPEEATEEEIPETEAEAATEPVTEPEPAAEAAVIYDPTTYILSVHVSRAEDGSLSEPEVAILRDGQQAEAVSFINTLTGTLRLSKDVKGVDMGRDFVFILQLDAGASGLQELPQEFAATLTHKDGTAEETGVTFTDGQCHVTLKNDENLLIRQIPIGTVFTITEGSATVQEDGSTLITADTPSGYTVTTTVETVGENGETDSDVQAGNTVNVETAAGETGVIFTNSSTYALPKTGGAGTIPYTMAGMMLMLLSAMCLLYKARKYRREAD